MFFLLQIFKRPKDWNIEKKTVLKYQNEKHKS